MDSAVLVKWRTRWVELIAEASLLPADTVESILESMIVPERPRDLYVHPFVALDMDSRLLGLAPHIVLRSNAEENILRMCSYRNPAAFDRISQGKEQEMMADLASALPSRLALKGPIPLPAPLPNLDFALEDTDSHTVALGELKWLRKPIGSLERFDRDAELTKGMEQVKKIARFLCQHPTYLSDRGVLSAPLSAFERVQYLLVARDHFRWVAAEEGYPVIEYETLKNVLRDASSLGSALTALLSYDWLPVENRDFVVRYERSCAEGVCVESEVFYGLRSFE